MTYQVGQKIQSTVNTGQEGMIEGLGPSHGGVQYYKVFWGGKAGASMVAEPDIAPIGLATKPTDAFMRGQMLGYDELQRIVTYHRLRRDEPLRNNVYAFNASRTELFPYQFKPLIKFLDSVSQRLLICDEVGLGKTIEAGLILTELRARVSPRRVLVVCPAALRAKWRLELRRRFDEDFRILMGPDLIEVLEDIERNPDRGELNGIVSLQTLRAEPILEYLERLSPLFDLVVIDEAHHMRNFGTLTRRAGKALSGSATAVVMLTATPVHLGTENLYSLLNILDEEDFPDRETAEARFHENEPIVEAQVLVSQRPPRATEALERMERASHSDWVRQHPLLPKVQAGLKSLASVSTESPDWARAQLRLQRDLASMNLLGHIFTRTRKREVHADVAERKARAVEIGLSPREREFYDAVTELARRKSEQAGRHPIITQWIVNNVQRRLASSVAATVEFFRGQDTRQADWEADDEEGTDDTAQEEASTVASLRTAVKELVRFWPAEPSDAKFDRFKSILDDQGRHHANRKVLVFAFFKPTLRYLERRLNNHGVGCARIDGDVDPDERERRMERFRVEESCRVMLSSRVGSEGLDFQFCDTIVNYDLPWNPMEVEQRIGRIDRIGQRSEEIFIFNLWTLDTIEERILRKLYERIGIFQRAVGTLDAVIGNAIRDLEHDLFLHRLSDEEIEERMRATEAVIVHQMEEQGKLEGQAARFLGVDQYFNDEVEGVQRNRRYVTGAQLHRFVEDYLRNHAPRTRFTYDPEDGVGQIMPDAALRSQVKQHGLSSEMTRILGAPDSGVPVTFERKIAVDRPDVDFVNALHPLVRLVVAAYETTHGSRPSAQSVGVTSSIVPLGVYVFMVFRVRIAAAKTRNLLEVVLLNESLEEACPGAEAEALMGEIVELGHDIKHGGWAPEEEWSRKAIERGQAAFLSRLEAQRKEYAEENDAFVGMRLANVRDFYKRQISKRQETLVRMRSEHHPKSVLQLWEGQIRRLETEYRHNVDDLEARRGIGVDWDEVTAGLVQVSPPES